MQASEYVAPHLAPHLQSVYREMRRAARAGEIAANPTPADIAKWAFKLDSLYHYFEYWHIQPEDVHALARLLVWEIEHSV
jgi:hypothetical protein